MIMALSALAAYSDSDESGPEEENTGYGTEKTVSVTNPALQSKQEVRRLVSVVAGRGKTRSSVKIGLPVVDSGENLSDDEESVSLPKRRKGQGGLAAFLPQPKRTPSLKGSKFSKPVTTTTLVPDTLRRKKPLPPQKKGGGGARKDKGRESDDDISGDEDTPFFSNLDTSQPTMTGYTTDLPTLQPPSSSTNDTHLPATSTASTHNTSFPPVAHPLVDEPSASSSGYYNNALPYVQYGQYPGNVHETGSAVHGSGPAIHETESTAHVPEGATDHQNSTTFNNPSSADERMLNDTAFRRLAGGSRKGRRKKEEEMSLEQIVDIHEQDNKHEKDKYTTMEHSYTSGTVPAHLAYDHTQKRKHQIHWLANQAKSKEIELKNFWSQAAHSRRQTQSKYGF